MCCNQVDEGVGPIACSWLHTCSWLVQQVLNHFHHRFEHSMPSQTPDTLDNIANFMYM